MTPPLKKLVYRALLELEKNTAGKIKFHQLSNVTYEPVVFIANCGTSELKHKGGFLLDLQYHGNFAYRSLVCLRDMGNAQHTLQLMLHELMHVIGVEELRDHPDAKSVLQQKGGASSSVMFYLKDRLADNKRHQTSDDPRGAFLGEIDKKLLKEIADLESSPGLNSFESMAIVANTIRQSAISFSYMYVYILISQLKDRNNNSMFSNKVAMLLARSCVIALLLYLDSAPESIAIQMGYTCMELLSDFLESKLGVSSTTTSLLMLPISLMSLMQHLEWFYTQSLLESVWQWTSLALATLMGGVAGYKTAALASMYVPSFSYFCANPVPSSAAPLHIEHKKLK